MVNGAITESNGAFEINNIPMGTYILQVDFIGYNKFILDSLSVKNAGSVIIGDIALKPSEQLLRAVTVTARAPVIESKTDKIIFNVGNDITSQGGAALDVLKKVPQVTVDVDGNVELQGNANVRFLINGKPSGIFGSSLTDALSSIPASQIKSIEAITTPGSKYDAQGTGGIINIILKENKLQGINGSINLSAGTRLENGAVNFNLKKNNFGLNAFFSGNEQLSSRTPSRQSRLSAGNNSGTVTRLIQDGYSDFKRKGYQSGIGFDWNMSKKDMITASLGYNHFSNSNMGITDQQQAILDGGGNAVSEIFSQRNSSNASGINTFDASFNYKRKFSRPGPELDVVYSSSYAKPKGNYFLSQIFKGENQPYSGLQSSNPGTDYQHNISIDYTHPVAKNFLLETGLKTVLQNIKSVTQVHVFDTAGAQFVNDPSQSNDFTYKMKVFAGYLSGSFRVFDWLNVKAGARMEHTDVKIDFAGANIPGYNILVPSVILSHDFGQQQSLKIAYSRRIERPEYRELNPFVNLSDPYNITTGNPALHPEIGDNIELGYSRTFEKGGSIYVALIERINSHDLKQITTFYPTYQIGDSLYTNVSVTRRQNIGMEYNSGLAFSGSIPITDRLTVRSTIQLTHKYIVSKESFGNLSTGFRNRYNLNVTYALPNDLILEAFGNFSAAARSVQGKTPQALTYTFAFRKVLFNKKASIGLTATNLFNRYIGQVSTIETDLYSSRNLRLIPYRSLGINVSYKFGKLDFKKGKNPNNDYLNSPPDNGN